MKQPSKRLTNIIQYKFKLVRDINFELESAQHSFATHKQTPCEEAHRFPNMAPYSSERGTQNI